MKGLYSKPADPYSYSITKKADPYAYSIASKQPPAPSTNPSVKKKGVPSDFDIQKLGINKKPPTLSTNPITKSFNIVIIRTINYIIIR